MPSVKPVGQGTERIEETLAQLFPGVPLARVDRDAMRRRGALEDTLRRVHSREVRLLVGTQMLTKGHHFPDVSLVVVLNADQGLFGTDFRAAERLAQTIVQVAGRAGRAERAGEVMIQTEFPGHPLLTQLVRGGYDAFASAALAEREQAGWPPFARVAVLRAEATRARSPMQFLQMARDLADLRRDGVEILGPAAAPMERRAGHFRAQLLLHAATHVAAAEALLPMAPCGRNSARGTQGALGAGRRSARAILRRSPRSAIRRRSVAGRVGRRAVSRRSAGRRRRSTVLSVLSVGELDESSRAGRSSSRSSLPKSR